MAEQEYGGNPYDYRAHDSVWKRVRPDLTPFPDFTPQSDVAPLSPAEHARQSELPGAEADACCLGSSAVDSLQVISGFMRAELASFTFERAFSCRAPGGYERTVLERLACEGEKVFRKLSAVYFLISDAFPSMERDCRNGPLPCWTEGLRDIYHAEVCGALNYRRAADGITDPCLIRIFEECSDRKSEHADAVLQLLTRNRRTRPR